ncbi:cobyric acid synthase [Kineosporia rhizophila]|uniref:cobyric acid synthase n=1 Tax=Kineosporia TaxID=49184 RepID=UPI001E355601|nr:MULTISPECIES: cobyric acid synthase [Kineosporia]MCE0534664.1 cobyric acid synthase [Kineosporia rhizophila]GLY15545.1 cobyric acid synthase [Kineosporia sp. NBRC 101677]
MSAVEQNGTSGGPSSLRGGLMVAGTTSDAGKSVLVAGLCRWLARQGVRVAPFKAQNMSLNSFVTRGGAEIGRAQAMQARAARIEPEAAMNPVLLKPGSDRTSQVVVMGRPFAEAGAMDYGDLTPRLLPVVLEALEDLRSRFDVVICEGAGSPAEINLRHRDITNLGLARPANLPVLVVGDIDRGGVFAALHGTLALLDADDQRHISGFVINKFRGDPALLDSGLDMIRKITGRPVLGVLPYLTGLWLDVEDSLDLEKDRGPMRPPLGSDVIRVAVPRLPRLSNVTDIDALAAEPGVAVRLVHHGAEIAGADLVVLPGTRATVDDLAWLRSTGLADAIVAHAGAGLPVLGICGGHQMLGRTVTDEVESRRGRVPGLGLLPTRTDFGAEKVLARPHGTALGHPVEGYEIHHGVVTLDPEAPEGLRRSAEVFLDGWRSGPVWGTTWHGALENDAFRRAFLTEIADLAGRDGFRVAPDTSFAALREARLDSLADMVADHLDVAALERLINGGVPDGLPFVPPGRP